MSIMIPSRSVQIQSKGSGRLSPDLMEVGKSFTFRVDKKRKRLILDSKENGSGDRLRVWRCGPNAKSGLISLGTALRYLGLDAVKLRGQSFDAKVVGEKIEIQF